ncbi:alpha/beta hydrolase [Rhodovarius crocodyli]|uniref:Alpha/beta hydrolase n=1 Tax=Rhodovarius crocodyli TaxID=1979269 RepID=A0A437LXA3_9PROT|nr:alpha/beta hydrolase [Rhodovarius crocodyli]RVT90010.1 alpha/beta hydrolase [Rhodovarius crocodyli]
MPLLLLPGFMLDADLWRDVEPGLRQFGPILHADLGQDDTLAGMARRALDMAPPRFAVVGFSMGGYVAREILRQAPERVSKLALVATSARGDSQVQARRRASADVAFRGLSRSAVARSLREPDDVLITRIQAAGERMGADAFRRQSLLEREDQVGRLDYITCPTLVVAGAEDRLRSLEEAQELRDGIPGATLTIVEGVGHMIPMEAPERLAGILSAFLE